MKNNIKMNKIFKKILHTREIGILIPFILICTIAAIANPVFISIENIIDISRSMAFVLIISVGMTFILIEGALDLSVGSVLGLGGMLTGFALVNDVPIVIAILFGVLIGGVIGFLNGFMVVKFKIPPLIATLGMMYIARGAIYVISKGRPFYPFPDAFKAIGQESLMGIPYIIYLAFVILLIGDFVLRKTSYGRRIMAIGGNEEAARVSGINISKAKIISYIVVSALAALAGILMASRLSSSQANAGTGWELMVIASVIIGGTSTYGGSGSIIGTLIGTAIMSVLTNAMVLIGVTVYWQNIVVGLIIILAVGLDTRRRIKISGSSR